MIDRNRPHVFADVVGMAVAGMQKREVLQLVKARPGSCAVVVALDKPGYQKFKAKQNRVMSIKRVKKGLVPDEELDRSMKVR